jgi:hypothetical protein
MTEMDNNNQLFILYYWYITNVLLNYWFKAQGEASKMPCVNNPASISKPCWMELERGGERDKR